jgi:gas vesicle protein
MENKTKSKIALGLILGVAAGAAVYYFMTNEDGKQQLSNVIDAVKDFSDKAKNTAVEQSSKLADKASNLASQYASKASDLASGYASRASDVTSKLAEDAQKNIERVG